MCAAVGQDGGRVRFGERERLNEPERPDGIKDWRFRSRTSPPTRIGSAPRGFWQGTAGLGGVYGLPGHGRRRRRLANEIPYEIGNPRRTPANVRQYLLGEAVQPAGVPAGWDPESGPGIVTDNAVATL
jgi:hypothetical protein